MTMTNQGEDKDVKPLAKPPNSTKAASDFYANRNAFSNVSLEEESKADKSKLND